MLQLLQLSGRPQPQIRCADSQFNRKFAARGLGKRVLGRRSRVEGKGVYPFSHQFAQRGIDQSLTFQTRLAGERLRHNFHPEVAFAVGAGAGVADVTMGLVDDRQTRWRERPLKPFFNHLDDAHRFNDNDIQPSWAMSFRRIYGIRPNRHQVRSLECFALRGRLPPKGGKSHSATMAKHSRERTASRETALRHTGRNGAIRSCEWPSCSAEGAYRAPKSRTDLNAYRWFCLEHVRAYNSSWNYYAGMTEAEVEADLRRDVVWQRPTWRWGTASGQRGAEQVAAEALKSAFGPEGFEEAAAAAPYRRRGGRETPEEMALETLGLKPPTTPQAVKARYKELAKKYHPDLKQTDEDPDTRSREEKIRDINRAYKVLMDGFAAGTVPR